MSEWANRTLKDADVRVIKGEGLTSDKMVSGEIPVIAGGLSYCGMHNRANRNENCITVSASGANAGAVLFHKSKIFATDCSSIEWGGSQEFLFYALARRQKEFTSMQSGLAQPHVYPRDIEKIVLFYPTDTKEQSRIAAVLTATDEAVAASRALVEKYTAVKQGLMQDLLSGRVRLAGFTGDWEQLKIGNLLDFKNGLNKGKEFFGTGIPIVNYMDVYTKPSIRAVSLEGRVNLSKNEIKRFEVRKGDVFFTRTSETVNEVGYASVLLDDVEDGVFSGFVLRGRPKNDKLDIYYCQYCFSTQEIRRAIIIGATSTTRALTSDITLKTSSTAKNPLGFRLKPRWFSINLISLPRRSLSRPLRPRRPSVNKIFGRN